MFDRPCARPGGGRPTTRPAAGPHTRRQRYRRRRQTPASKEQYWPISRASNNNYNAKICNGNFNRHNMGQSVSHLRTGYFVEAVFYCQYAFADCNERIPVMEKMLEFSSAVLHTLSKKVKASRTYYRALGREPIPVYRQSARR